MLFTDQLFESAKDLWEGYLVHPFIVEMGEGTLPKEKFKFYLEQDYLYLMQYAKLFAAGVLKAKTVEEIKLFAGGIDGSLEDETAVHMQYLAGFGITPEMAEAMPSHLTNVSYTSYMLGIALTGDIKELVATLLPCIWSYYYIGEHLATTYKEQLGSNYYEPWISSYASGDYAVGCEKWIKYSNELMKDATEKEQEKLKEIFRISSEYETAFWDMAYTVTQGK